MLRNMSDFMPLMNAQKDLLCVIPTVTAETKMHIFPLSLDAMRDFSRQNAAIDGSEGKMHYFSPKG